jgi:hypothetical protein
MATSTPNNSRTTSCRLYSGNASFKSLLGHINSDFIVFFFQSFQADANVVPQLGHDRFLSSLFNLSLIHHPTIQRHVV